MYSIDVSGNGVLSLNCFPFVFIVLNCFPFVCCFIKTSELVVKSFKGNISKVQTICPTLQKETTLKHFAQIFFFLWRVGGGGGNCPLCPSTSYGLGKNVLISINFSLYVCFPEENSSRSSCRIQKTFKNCQETVYSLYSQVRDLQLLTL